MTPFFFAFTRSKILDMFSHPTDTWKHAFALAVWHSLAWLNCHFLLLIWICMIECNIMLLKVYVYMDIAGRQIDLWIYTVFLRVWRCRPPVPGCQRTRWSGTSRNSWSGRAPRRRGTRGQRSGLKDGSTTEGPRQSEAKHTHTAHTQNYRNVC